MHRWIEQICSGETERASVSAVPTLVVLSSDAGTPTEQIVRALIDVLPSTDERAALRICSLMARAGSAVVWAGHRELAEHYREQLIVRGLRAA